MPSHLMNREQQIFLGRKYFYRAFLQCCGPGLGSGDFLTPGSLNPGWVESQHPDPG